MNVKNLPSFMSSLPAVPETVVIRGGRGMGIITSLIQSDVVGGPDKCARYIMLRDMVSADFLNLPYYADVKNSVLATPGALFVEYLPPVQHLLIIDSIDDCPIGIQEIVFGMARYRMVGETALPDNCRVVLLDFGNVDYEQMSVGWQNVMDHCRCITID